MKEGKKAFPGEYDKDGIKWPQLKASQQQALMTLINQAYINDLNEHYASQVMKEIEQDKNNIRFTYYGETNLQEPHHYQIIGSDIVLLLFNTQNGTQKTPVNHVHQIWRSRKSDFGGK